MGSAFDLVAEAIERATDLARLEARGTLRLALKGAGFDARTVKAAELVVVLERVLPRELALRGVADAEAVCRRVARTLADWEDTESGAESTSPESIFARLADR
jgi:hypothetical protein